MVVVRRAEPAKGKGKPSLWLLFAFCVRLEFSKPGPRKQPRARRMHAAQAWATTGLRGSSMPCRMRASEQRELLGWEAESEAGREFFAAAA